MQTNTNVKRLLTATEAAKYLNISSRGVSRLREQGLLPAVTIRRSVRYDLEDLEKFVKDHKTKDREIVDQLVKEVGEVKSSKEDNGSAG